MKWAVCALLLLVAIVSSKVSLQCLLLSQELISIST